MKVLTVAAGLLSFSIFRSQTGVYLAGAQSTPQAGRSEFDRIKRLSPAGGQDGHNAGGERGGWGGGMGAGRGLYGTVTEVAADHYTIKTELG